MKKTIYLLIIMGLALTGCASKTKSSETKTLHLGTMPAVDAAPIFYAQDKGYFQDLGLEVTLDVYQNAMDRQSALQSKSIDGALTDIIALMQNVDAGFDMKITLSTDTSFPIVVKDPEVLNKDSLSVALMEVSVSNYLLDQAFPDTQLEKIYINEIPARLEMLGSGKVEASVLPEPVASMGELKGLTKRNGNYHDEWSPNVIVFTDEAIKEKSAEIKIFHEVYNKAVEDMKDHEDDVRESLVKHLELNPEVKQLMELPVYKKGSVPDEAFMEKLARWNNDTLDSKVTVDYKKMVNNQFIK